MPPVGFEPTISAGERPQTHALDRAATGTGTLLVLFVVCFPGVATHCGCIFHSPVAGFSLLVFEVSWSHTTTRHSR